MFRPLRKPLALVALVAGACLLSGGTAQAGDKVIAAGAVSQCNNCGQCSNCRGRGRGGHRGGGLRGRNACQNCRPYQAGRPDLFANYYVPGACGGVPAQMYIAPGPVPQHVGHTYYTYQPFMPHEMMYRHYRGYHRYYDGGRGLTRTRVIWW